MYFFRFGFAFFAALAALYLPVGQTYLFLFGNWILHVEMDLDKSVYLAF